MKLAASLLLCLLATQQGSTAGRPLIPAELNSIFSQIRLGMTVPVVEGILRASYPGMTPLVGDWSSGSGTIVYRLDDRYTLAVYCEEVGNKRLVHADLRFVLYERPANRRVTLSVSEWND